MTIYCKHVFTKTFDHEVSKKAYLNACKWLAQNIYSKPGLTSHVTVEITKKKAKKPTFVVKVYVKADEEDARKNFCTQCKHLHTIFYSVDGMNCDECRAHAYFKQTDRQIDGKVCFVKEILEEKEAEEQENEG